MPDLEERIRKVFAESGYVELDFKQDVPGEWVPEELRKAWDQPFLSERLAALFRGLMAGELEKVEEANHPGRDRLNFAIDSQVTVDVAIAEARERWGITGNK